MRFIWQTLSGFAVQCGIVERAGVFFKHAPGGRLKLGNLIVNRPSIIRPLCRSPDYVSCTFMTLMMN